MRFAVYLLVALSIFTLFLGLGRPAISDSDEAFYAEAGREMVTGGDWLTPHFNYEPRFQKPILFYWIVAASYTAAGIGEGAARFGSALAGLGLVLLTFTAGRRWYDRPTGLLAGVVVATSYGCAFASRLSLPDLPLAFFITVATWSTFVALFDRSRRARPWWLLAGFAGALGFLTKGPVAVVVPLLAVAGPLFLERAWRRVRIADLLLAVGLFLLVAAPWYAAMAAIHGLSYLRGFFIGDNLERFATTVFNPHRPIYFYVPIVLGGMLPWSPFLALGAAPLLRLARHRKALPRTDVRALCWALAPLLLFTVSVGKQPRYILPMLAPLGLLLAVWMRRAATTPSPLPEAHPPLFRWMAGVSGVIVVGLALLVWRARSLLFALPAGHLEVGVAALAVSGLLVVLLSLSGHWRRAPVAIAASAVVFVLVLRFVVLALPDLDPVEYMAGRVLAHRGAGERVASYRVFVRNLVFYTHVQQSVLYVDEDLVSFLDTADRVLCVLPERELRRLQEPGGGPGAERRVGILSGVRRLESITYFDASTAKIGAVLRPDPGRDLQTAVLISNR